ncbi:hypothetical protein [Sinimarinibacterium flocculans]|uniref:hypothetical protein n=1 Tax=Sinimarinibacterium flocculans TaxID=985250 RepID=UPI003510F4C3
MSAGSLIAASDAGLAVVAIWVGVRFAQTELPRPQRVLAAAGALLIAAAAAVGCLRFAGLDELRELHMALSNQGAIIGLPAMLVAVSWSWLDGRLPGAALTAAVAILLTGLAWAQLRPVAGAVSFLLVLTRLMVSRDRRVVPVLMLATLGGLAWLAAARSLGADGRLVLLHAALAVLLLLTLQALPRASLRRLPVKA